MTVAGNAWLPIENFHPMIHVRMDPALELTAALAQKLSHKANVPEPFPAPHSHLRVNARPHFDIHPSSSEFLHYLMSKVRRQSIFLWRKSTE